MEPDILIRHGHVENARGFDDIPDIDNFLDANSGHRLRLAPDANLERLRLRIPSIKTVLVEFPSFADGRGFSIGRELRKKFGFTGQLIAEGPLIPDQYAYALQCGFNAVKVDGQTFARQSESDWFKALEAFSSAYQRGYTDPNVVGTSVLDARKTRAHINAKDDAYFGLSAEDALARAIETYKGKIVVASSLGVDSAVLLHMVARIDPATPIIFLDTGKHFRETLHYRDQLVSDLSLTDFRNIIPDKPMLDAQDPEGQLHQTEPDACCQIRKVIPLDGAIGHFEARITGRKRYQTAERANMPVHEMGGRQVKINPLAYWTAKDVTAYMRKHDLPPHPLISLGFLSIGCQPCTTRVTEGEDPRAGRWRDSDKTECGIHYIDGKWVLDKARKTYEVF